MRILIQAIKLMLEKLENLINSTASDTAAAQSTADNAKALAEAANTGLENKLDSDTPSGTGALSLNRKAGTTVGAYSVAVGYDCTASGEGSFAQGGECEALGKYSHAEGLACKSRSLYSHSENAGCSAYGAASHAEGWYTVANGTSSHTEGHNTKTEAGNAHAEGMLTTAASENQHVQGRCNVIDTEGKYAHIVGNGSGTTESNAVRSNAHTLDWDGNAWFAGTVEGTALILKSSTEDSAKRFRITVDDSGTLTATEVT